MKSLVMLGRRCGVPALVTSAYLTLSSMPDVGYRFAHSQAKRVANPPLSVASIKGGRSYMEDEYLVNEDNASLLLAVFDGHGGADVSQYMKKHFLEILEGCKTSKNDAHSEKAEEIKITLAKIDEQILSGPHAHRFHEQGSTSCMVYLEKTKSDGSCDAAMTLTASNVGDSRAVLARGMYAVELTEDHKPELPEEKQRVEGFGGYVSWHGSRDKSGNPIPTKGVYRVNGNLALSRSMGDRYMRPFVSSEPDFKHVELTPDDEFIIVATDGIWDVFSSQECVDTIKKVIKEYSKVPKEAESLQGDELTKFKKMHEERIDFIRSQMASIITAIAVRRGSMDNITVLIKWLK